jgi:GNAT superfamily N-acetyltransferase
MRGDVARARAVEYRTAGPVDVDALSDLMLASWPDASPRDWRPVLAHSLVTVCAYRDESLVGFVHVAWDGGVHAFLLDPTVHPDYRRRGTGARPWKRDRGARRGCTWTMSRA